MKKAGIIFSIASIVCFCVIGGYAQQGITSDTTSVNSPSTNGTDIRTDDAYDNTAPGQSGTVTPGIEDRTIDRDVNESPTYPADDDVNNPSTVTPGSTNQIPAPGTTTTPGETGTPNTGAGTPANDATGTTGNYNRGTTNYGTGSTQREETGTTGTSGVGTQGTGTLGTPTR